MGLFINLSVLALFCAAFGHRIRVPSEEVNYQLIKSGAEKDRPLNVTLISVGDRYVVFNISGSDTVGGLPVSQLFINYTTNGPTVDVRSEVVSTAKLNGDMHQTIKIIDLAPGLHYDMQFFAENSKKELGPPSRMMSVLTLPPTPDITVLHPSLQKLKVIWGERMSHSEDYFLLTVEKVGVSHFHLVIRIPTIFFLS